MSKITFINKSKLTALVILGIMILLGIFYPYLAPYNPDDFTSAPLLSPHGEHWLGTNNMGQDNFSSLLAGFRITITIALTAATLTMLIGTFMAATSAYYGGWVDRLIMRVTEIFIIVPDIIVIMIFATFAGPRLIDVILVMVFFSWSRVCRVLRARCLVIIKQEDLQYTLLLKGGLLEVGRKMWPYLFPAVIALFIQQLGRAAVTEATLSFLGVGDPTIHSWGRTIRNALDYPGIFWDGTYWWWLLPPMVCLIIFVISLSLLSFNFDDKNSLKENTKTL